MLKAKGYKNKLLKRDAIINKLKARVYKIETIIKELLINTYSIITLSLDS